MGQAFCCPWGDIYPQGVLASNAIPETLLQGAAKRHAPNIQGAIMSDIFIETDCVISYEGKTFESGGAVVTPEYAIGYPKFDGGEFVGVTGVMQDWHGNRLGTCRIVSSWLTPRSFVSFHMYQIEALINGVRYTGRGAGNGMIWRGKRCKRQ